jgi:hypothetical protein
MRRITPQLNIRRALACVLAVLLLSALLVPVLSFSTSAAESGTCGDGLIWSLSAGTLTISGQGSMAIYNELDMPPWFEFRDQIYRIVLPEGLKSISSLAFYQCKNLKAVYIPDSVTRIEARAFYQADFACAVLPDTVTYIGDYAFYQLTGPGILWTVGEQISRMTGLTYLGKYALALSPHTGSVSLTLPEGVTAVEDGLVSGGYWCTVTLTLPKSVTYIGADIFTGWSSTASITYQGTVEEWRAIEKHGGWNNRMPPITVTCTDGEVVTEDRYISIDGT